MSFRKPRQSSGRAEHIAVWRAHKRAAERRTEPSIAPESKSLALNPQ